MRSHHFCNISDHPLDLSLMSTGELFPAWETSAPVQVESIDAVVTWVWDVAVDECAICKLHVMGPCADCQLKETSCAPTFGKCGHTFHRHCLSNWLQVSARCPLDNQAWIEATQ